ncbi:MAG: hypothetical protein PVI00_03285 [Desulfobacterales bacterium]
MAWNRHRWCLNGRQAGLVVAGDRQRGQINLYLDAGDYTRLFKP